MAIGGLSPLLTTQNSDSVLRAESIGFRLRDHADQNGDGVVTGLERIGHAQTQAPSTLLETLQAIRQEGLRGFTAAKATDPQDLNGDGRVDGAEKRAYARTHPWARAGLDPMDRDGDGVVTAAERLAYENAHPPVDPTYGSKGQIRALRTGILLDRYA